MARHDPHPRHDSTGVVLLKKIAEELAYPTMTCPITGKPFKASNFSSGLGAKPGLWEVCLSSPMRLAPPHRRMGGLNFKALPRPQSH